MARSRLHLYSILTALFTLVLVMTGAAVTSWHNQPSRPELTTIHSIVAGIDVLLIFGLAIARARFGWIALILAIAQAGIGSPPLRAGGPISGTLHGILGACLFVSICVIALCTSPMWQREPEFVQDYGWPSNRFMTAATACLVAIQVAFGAGLRHSAVGVMPHLMGALVVALFIMIAGAFVTNQFAKHPALRPMAVSLMTITGIQVFLGMAAFLLRSMDSAAPRTFLAISVAHVATGSLTFAASVLLAIEVRRDVTPRPRD